MPNSRVPQTSYGFGSPGDQSGGRMSTGPVRSQMSQNNNDLAGLINQQPLPYNQTPEYQQMQGLINQQSAQLGTYGSQLAAQNAQLAKLAAADPTKMYMRQLMNMYKVDPLAQFRGQIARMYNPTQQMNWAVPLYGFENTWSG